MSVFPLPHRAVRHAVLATLFVLTATPGLAGSAAAAPAPDRPARPTDPVLAAIATALEAEAITPAKAVQLRTVWRTSARAERNARAGERRTNIRAVRLYATTLARRRGLTPQRLEPVLLSVKATSTILGSRRRMPRHEQELQLPGEPLVFTYYKGRGIQFQPFETFKLGTSYLNGATPRIGAARRVADRMLELSSTASGSTSWEFYFPFGGPATPWRSSIAQALGLRLYSRMAQHVPEPERAPYLAAADAIVASHARSTTRRGVAAAQGGGSFYVMYSFNPRQRILNGHLESLLNLYRYGTESGSVAAMDAYQRGYRALVPLMPRFDRGDWSNYQLGQEADREYHAFVTDQLMYLARETRDPMFVDYARRFRIYLEEPASLGVRVVLLPSLVLPRGDRYRDTIPVRFELNKAARVTLVISRGGRVQRRITSRARRGINTMYWNGRTTTGRAAPNGSYTGRFIIVDRFGRLSRAVVPAPLVIEHDTKAPIPILATLTDIEGGGTRVTLNVEETASRWYEGQLSIAGAPISGVVRIRSGPITFTVARPRAEVETASVRLVDNSGNESTTTLAGILNPSTVSG